MDLRAGRSKPRRKNQEMLAAIVKKLANKMHGPERKP
jgi:hypothetical protein